MRMKLILFTTVVAALALSGCQSAEEPQVDLRELSSDDLIEALTAMVDEIEELYAEEITLLEELWALEVEHGQPDRDGNFYRFRFYPRRLPGSLSVGLGDFDSVEKIRELRATRITQFREQLTEFDLSRPRAFIPSSLETAKNRITRLENTLRRALAEIEFDKTGRRPSQ